MRHVVRIEDATGTLAVEEEPGLGLLLVVKVGELTLSFGLDREGARRLAEALAEAAGEGDGPGGRG